MTYNGKVLKKVSEKIAGKNRGEFDGFYRCDEDGSEYFIKKPEKVEEFFTELFSGFLLKEFIAQGLIDPVYHQSFICADWIKLPDNSFALIQPKVNFTELFKIIGQDTTQSDRSAVKEIRATYEKLRAEGAWFALPQLLMLSLVFGDNSVHSGNVVRLNQFAPDKPGQFARIDWGAAFRSYAHTDNNINILKTREIYQLIASWTKDYYPKYQCIPNLFPAVASSATDLEDKINAKAQESGIAPAKLIEGIVSKALAAFTPIPLTISDRKKIADNLCIPSFVEVNFNNKASHGDFAEPFGKVFIDRLQKTAALKEDEKITKAAAPNLVEIVKKPQTSFVDVILTMQNMGSQLTAEVYSQLDVNGLNVLVEKFNRFIAALANHAEAANFWGQENSNENILAPLFKEESNELYHGDAFVPYYREGTIMRRLYSILPINERRIVGAGRFQPYDENCLGKISNEKWQKIQTLLSSAVQIISTINKINQFPEEFKDQIELIIPTVSTFMSSYLEIENELLSSAVSKKTYESDFFYPITDEQLNKMTGEQLATICLQELNSDQPSLLIARIISDLECWESMSLVFESKSVELGENNIERIKHLKSWRSAFENLLAYDAEKLTKNGSSAEFTNAISEITKLCGKLPDVLKGYGDSLTSYISKLKKFKAIDTVGEISLDVAYISIDEAIVESTEAEEVRKNKRSSFFELRQSFYALPLVLQEKYQVSYSQACNEFTVFLDEEKCWHTMEDEQLAGLCLEELKYGEPGRVIEAVINDDLLWNKINAVSQFKDDREAMAKLRTWRQQVAEFTQLSKNFDESVQTRSSRKIQHNFLEMKKIDQQLPQRLQRTVSQEKVEASQQPYTELVDKETQYKNQLDQINQQPTRTAFSKLHNAFSNLPEDLQDEYKKGYIEKWSLAVKLLQSNELSDISDVNQKLEAIATLQISYDFLKNKKLIEDELETEHTQLLEVNGLYGRLIQMTENDEDLKNAISNKKLSKFTDGLINDLFILNQFYKEQTELNKNNKYGKKYTDSLKNFYQQALEIRLSDNPLIKQEKDMKDLAHKEFNHRHRIPRLLADALMVIGMLFGVGFVVGAIRTGVLKSSFFFSNAKTGREEKVAARINCAAEENEGQEQRLFAPLPISV